MNIDKTCTLDGYDLNKRRHSRQTGVLGGYVSFLLLLLVVSVHAQNPLKSYLETAAKSNPAYLQRYAEYEAAMQKIPQAGSLPDPEVILGVWLSPMELIGGKQLADIRLMQMFPWFGVLKYAKDEMSLMAQAKHETLRDAGFQLYFDVSRTWYELYKVEQNIRVSEQSLELLRTIERLSVIRFKASPLEGNSRIPSAPSSMASSSAMGGNAMASSVNGTDLTDVYRIQMEISSLKNDIELLKSQRTTLTVQFNSLLNRPTTSSVNLPDTMTLEFIDPALLTLSDSSFINNPMLGMLRFERQSLEVRKHMVTRMGYPMIGVGVNYSLIGKNGMSTESMNGRDMVMPMVTARLPIYRKKYKAMQAEVDWEKTANEQNYQATGNALKTEYVQAIQSYHNAQRRIELYKGQLQLVSQSLDILLKSYASSGSDLTAIIRLQQQKLDFAWKQVEAVSDYNTSVAWIKRLLAISFNL